MFPIIQETPSKIDMIGALGPVIVGILSAIVSIFVILYRKQQKQLEAQHEAILVIEQADWNGDKLEVELANYGNGAAENVHLTTLVEVDNGSHREYTIHPDLFQRPQSQSWTVTVPANNQPVSLEAESKVRMPVYRNHPRNWAMVSFSNFLGKMKRSGANEVKFIHLIRANDLAGNLAYRQVYPEMRITDPQQFSRGDNLSSLSTVTYTSKDGTFRDFYNPSRKSRVLQYTYNRGITLLNWLPFISISPRPLDATGTERVKRIFLRWKVESLSRDIKDALYNITTLLRSTLLVSQRVA